MYTETEKPVKKRPANLTIREDLIEEARALSINISRAAEQGIIDAIRKSKEITWLEENKEAFEAHNKRIKERKQQLNPYWRQGGDDGAV